MNESSLLNEHLLTLADAAGRLPAHRKGRPVSVSCILRWILGGARSPAGKVRLEAIRMGGKWLTSVEALDRFARAQTPDLNSTLQLPRTSTTRLRAHSRAEAEVKKKFRI